MHREYIYAKICEKEVGNMKEKKYVDFLSNYFDILIKQDKPMEFDLSYRIKKSFSFVYVEINKELFVIAEYHLNEFNVNEFNSVRNQIEKNIECHVIFYFNQLKTHHKMSLTKYRIGYIIGNHQFYIPELSILINDNFDKSKVNPSDYLSLEAQNVLFKLLVLDQIELYQRGLDTVIEEKEYTVYRSIKELENKGIIRVEKPQNHRVVMLDNKEDIWNKAKPYLKSPIMEEVYVETASLFSHNIPLVKAGQTALSNVGMIVSNEEVYAIENKEYKKIKDTLKQSFKGHDNAIKLQIWKTKIIKINNNQINPFALYLSLQGEFDERVQMDYENYISKYWR